jgi:type IV secretory pathway protease TraF
MRSLASRLRVAGRRAHEAAADPTLSGETDQARPGAAELRVRRRIDVVDRAAAAATQEVDRVGRALQDFATDLAELHGQYHRLAGRATAAGLRVVDGSLVPAWGVAGVADPQTVTTQEAVRSSLQRELDAVLRTLALRRQRLLTVLHEGRGRLDEHRTALRR